jgi:hypothetical protein
MDEFTANILKDWGFKEMVTIYKGNVEQIIIIYKRFVTHGR